MINYTVGPPDRLKMEGSPITVGKKTSLKDIADSLSPKVVTLYYACCSSSHSPEATAQGTDATRRLVRSVQMTPTPDRNWQRATQAGPASCPRTQLRYGVRCNGDSHAN